MHDFQYVTKKEAAPIKAELLDIIHEVQDILRDDFTFRYDFIGSSSRNMITQDIKSNIGFDFDVNIEVNDDNKEYSAKELRTILRNAIDKVATKYGYNYCEDSTRVLTIKKVDRNKSRIIHSCDFAISIHMMKVNKNILDIINLTIDMFGQSREKLLIIGQKKSIFWKKTDCGTTLEIAILIRKT